MPKITRPTRPLADVNVLAQKDGSHEIVACFMPDPDLIFGEGETRAFLALDASLSMKKMFGFGGPFGGDPNYVELVARKVGAILTSITRSGKVSALYWAVSPDGSKIEDIGEFDEESWATAAVGGPKKEKWGRGTKLLPVIQHGIEQIAKGTKGTLGVIITDGIIEDEQECVNYCLAFGKKMSGHKPEPVKLVLIGIGEEVDEGQLERFDDMFEGTGIVYDLWSAGMVASMKDEADILAVLFGELVDEETVIAATGRVEDGSGNVLEEWADGLPGKFRFVLPKGGSTFIIRSASQTLTIGPGGLIMSLYDRLFGRNKTPAGSPPPAAADDFYTIPSPQTAKEFGKVNVRKTSTELEVQFTILMEVQGQEAEGWQTGVAMDASASMKGWYGRMLQGKVPPEVAAEYEKKGWLQARTEDGRRVKSFQKTAYDDAIQKGYLKFTPNIIQPLAREFIAYLAGSLDADGGTTVIYWACGDGTAFEVLGDFTEDQCHQLDILGPKSVTFGTGTVLTPAVKYFVERFADARRGMYIFITDGKLDDLAATKQYTTELAKAITADKRNPVKCVLIGVGDEIDEQQMEQLDNLDTGTDVDIWDHKIAKEMRALVEIFAELVTENQLVAPTGTVFDSDGKVIKAFTDGLPARISVLLPLTSPWFELEVHGQRIRQNLVMPQK